jgi:hypothetical protein
VTVSDAIMIAYTLFGYRKSWLCSPSFGPEHMLCGKHPTTDHGKMNSSKAYENLASYTSVSHLTARGSMQGLCLD